MKSEKTLKVVMKVTKTSHLATHDNIWLDVGKYRWRLSDQNKAVSKKEHEEFFFLEIHKNFEENFFSRILICKDPDENHKTWYLEGLKIVLGEKIIYENLNIDHLFEDSKNSEWLASDFNPMVSPVKSLVIPEEELFSSVNGLLRDLFVSGSWNKLRLKGSLKIDVECQNITISQNFEADIVGPNPTLTLWMKLVPYIHDQKVEVRIRSYEVFADYPLWFEIATLGISNLMEVHIQGGIKKRIKEDVQGFILQKIANSNIEGDPIQISLRPHKIEVLF